MPSPLRTSPPASTLPQHEQRLRERLAIPSTSTEVMVVAESSHWDPNWLLSSDRYYRSCVRPTLDQALDALRAEPRRVFSLECMFFVDLYWRDRPERRSEFVDLVNAGRLRFTGCGVTTPDTLLPEDEMLLRDLLVGQEWLRARGMDQEPRLLYLPDSFGHSPGLPALLHAAGIEHAAVCRIDGMRFPGADLESAANFPRPGTSAAQLLAAGTADFVWRAADGSEVLTHWMAHGYGHGDMIASGGLTRMMALPTAWPNRRPAHVDARVDSYLDTLRTVARTPYRLLAIGADFVRPIPRLVELLDDWNDRHHDRTGTWLVNASAQDYLDLVSFHRNDLPVIEFDPNPYWMGFYATRPELKAAARDLGRRLLAVDAQEATSTLTPDSPAAKPTAQRPAWWIAATSNHHDFVTGTAPDRVAHGEQAAWLAKAIASAPWPDTPPNSDPDPSDHPSPDATPGEPLAVRSDGHRTAVVAQWGTATFDPKLGGALVSLTDGSGAEMLTGPSLELRSYSDSGGLWRLGNEIHGGRWSLTDRSTDHRANVRVDLDGDGETAHVHVRMTLAGRTSILEHTIRSDDPTILTASSVDVPRRRTVTLAVQQVANPTGVTMHQPGGLVDRPLRRWYEPTYWPLHSFAVTQVDQKEPSASRAFAVAAAAPTGVHLDGDGTVEVIVARTAVKEVAFGVIPVMAPAWGLAWARQAAVIAWGWHSPVRHRGTVDLGRHLCAAADRAVGRTVPNWPVHLSDPDVEIAAVKPADRGPGTIVRLRNWAPSASPSNVLVSLGPHLGTELVDAWLTDSRERDIARLSLTAGGVDVAVSRHITSIRLITGQS